MSTSTAPFQPSPKAPIERVADALVIGVARHWLAIFNGAWLVYVGLPILAPVLMHWGWTWPAQWIYRLYSFFCHQLPDHSYFLFGPNLTPLQPALQIAGMQTGNLLLERTFIGNAAIGYKVAICERDIAIYGSILLAGLLYSLLRSQIQPISIKWYLLFLVPIGLDGGTQLIGLHESNWWLRSVTGILFGAGSVWLAYPFLQSGMDEVIESEQRRRAAKELMAKN